MKKSQIALAVDVGFGHTKYTAVAANGTTITCSSFPSVAAHISGTSTLGGGIGRLNTVTVEVNNQLYEVGPDASLSRDAYHSTVRDHTYVKTDTYHALVLGALSHMNALEIDLLVMGLPIKTIGNTELTQYLSDTFAKEHTIPMLGQPGHHRKVTVKRVSVVAQPIGCLLDATKKAAKSGGNNNLQHECSLIVDPGTFTLDWLVTNGFKPMKSRSGATDGGMSAVHAAIRDSINARHGFAIKEFDRIEQAIMREQTTVKLYGQEIDISEHLDAGRAKIRQFLSELANKVGESSDIDNIIIGGGPAKFFKPLLEEKFPNRQIIVAEDSIFANVRGFQIYGENLLLSGK